MYIHKVTIKTPTHCVFITVKEDGKIHLFKYNERTCDFDVFDNQHEASEWILNALPTHYYRVTFPGEPD